MNILAYIKAHKIIVAIGVIVIIGLSWFFLGRGGSKVSYDTETATLRTVVEEVDVTGTVTPTHDVSLAFEMGGRVASVSASVGSAVYAGQTLAYLSNADIYADRAGAVAQRDARAADLAELLAGTRATDLAVYDAKVTQAESALSDAKTGVVNAIEDAFTRVDNAVRNDTDQLFSNPDTSSPDLTIPVNSPTLEDDVEWRRFLLGEKLDTWQLLLTGSETSIIASTDDVSGYLDDARTFLQKISLVVNELQPSTGLSQTMIDAYKADISAARTSVNAAVSGLLAAKEGYTAAEQNLIVAERQRDAAAAPATPEKIAAAEAALAAAQATVDGYDARIAKTVITAPVSGTVTRVDTNPGEIVAAGKEVMRIISTGAYEIEAYIPEADITSVRRGDTATFTLDAYDDSVKLSATVSMIDPAETIIEGVSTYKVVMHFEDPEDLVRSGMTANVTIVADTRENVIAVPSRAVETASDGTKTVQVLVNGTPESRIVSTGLKGSDGYIEITNGLTEGEEVVVFVRE